MGRFQPVYTDEQRAAVTRATLPAPQGDGLSYAETARRAAAGTLVEGLAPFHIPTSTVASLKRRALGRDKKGETPAGPDAAAQLRRRLLNLAEAQLDRAERQQRQNKLTGAELESVARGVLRIAAEIEKREPPNPARDNGKATDTPPGGIFERIAKEERKTQ